MGKGFLIPRESIHHYGAPLSGRKHPSVAKGLQPDAVQNPISSCGLKSTFQVRCLTSDTRTLLNDFLWYLLVFNSSFALFDQCQKRTKVMHLKMQICMASFGVGALHAPPCCCTSWKLSKGTSARSWVPAVRQVPQYCIHTWVILCSHNGSESWCQLEGVWSVRNNTMMPELLRSQSPKMTGLLPTHPNFLLGFQKRLPPKWWLEEQF